MTFQINTLPSRSDPDRLVCACATSLDGQKLVSAEARFLGERLMLQFLSVSPKATLDTRLATMAATGILAVFNSSEVPFVPAGRALREEQRIAEQLGFVEQTIHVQSRLRLFGYELAPTGALVLDPTSPMAGFFDERVGRAHHRLSDC